MPIIEAPSVENLLAFIQQRKVDIENGKYDISIRPEWVTSIPEEIAIFLVSHCESSRLPLCGRYQTSSLVLETAFLKSREEPNFAPESTKPDYYSYDNLTGDPDSPVDIDKRLKELTESSFCKIRVSASRYTRPVFLADVVANDKNEIIRAIAAANPNLPADKLKSLLNDSDYKVRKVITRNEKTTSEILEILSMDTNEYVRAAVGNSLKTSPQTLDVLSKDSSFSVQKSVSKNPNTPKQSRAYAKRKVKEYLKSTKSGCFIATAVYGDGMAIEVILLRQYRDQKLMVYGWGRLLVKLYYIVSPPLAHLLDKSEWAKQIVRYWILDPIVGNLRNRLS